MWQLKEEEEECLVQCVCVCVCVCVHYSQEGERGSEKERVSAQQVGVKLSVTGLHLNA